MCQVSPAGICAICAIVHRYMGVVYVPSEVNVPIWSMHNCGLVYAGGICAR